MHLVANAVVTTIYCGVLSTRIVVTSSLRMFDWTLETDRRTTTRVAVRLNILHETGAALYQSGCRASNRILFITDTHVGGLYATEVLDSVRSAGFDAVDFRIAPGEASKALDVAERIYRCLAENEFGRETVVLALGGGVVSDLAGFVAATWMRGIDFVVCPTTLEADVDACLGGKTAVNLRGMKNQVGVFHHPRLVLVDPSCLRTLDERDIRAGLAESIKHALISSEDFLAWHERHAEAILDLNDDLITELIRRNLRIKADIVSRDAFEQTGLRMRLNLGHTIGHAMEACSGYQLRHGECVGLGTLAACRLSNMLGLLDGATVERVADLLARLGLPTRLTIPMETDRVMAALRSDKKKRCAELSFVLLEGVGQPTIRSDVPQERIRAAYESLLPGAPRASDAQ